MYNLIPTQTLLLRKFYRFALTKREEFVNVTSRKITHLKNVSDIYTWEVGRYGITLKYALDKISDIE